MNRKEAIEIIKNSNIYGARMNGKNLIIEAINELAKDITLADLLGWEENVEYELEDRFYTMEFFGLDLPTHYKMKVKLCSDSLEFNWKGGYLKTRSLPSVIDELKRVKKVQKKLKAYHVKDEYSYNCLMKELEEQGYMWIFDCKPTTGIGWEMYEGSAVILCDKNKNLSYSSLSYHNIYLKGKYYLIEYKKEEPRFYAKIKGWELNYSPEYTYWNYDLKTKELMIYGKNHWDLVHAKMTKTEWNKLGINDTNADWEEVAE